MIRKKKYNVLFFLVATKSPYIVYGAGIILQHVKTSRNLYTERGFFLSSSSSGQQQVCTVAPTYVERKKEEAGKVVTAKVQLTYKIETVIACG